MSDKDTKSIFSFGELEAKTAKKIQLKPAIRSVLRANEGECYAEVEPILMAHVSTGNKEWDHHNAVNVLMKYDSIYGGAIASILRTRKLPIARVWKSLYEVLKDVGLACENGIVVGLLEDLSSTRAEEAEVELATGHDNEEPAAKQATV